MGLLLYNILTQSYFFGIRIASFWNHKAKLWVQGRVGVYEGVLSEIASQRIENQQLVWMHCASLGEFEQGRPVLEALRKQYPQLQILLSFFSPSGYEIRKDYPVADWVVYLPTDSAHHAKRFIQLTKPGLAIFVKYEFWYHYLRQLREKSIPTLLISAIFRPSQPFFKWYGSLHRQMLRAFSTIMVQDDASKEMLSQIGFIKVQVAGDTRVDRVIEIAANPLDLPQVKQFFGNAPVLVCGSTWPADEAVLNPIFSDAAFKDWKFILAPHDVQVAHLQAIEGNLTVPHLRFSQLRQGAPLQARLLLIDNIGLLSSLYQFGKIAYIGGGFGQGIHNTLEPAAYGLPVIFGPKYENFEEARWLVEHGGAFKVANSFEVSKAIRQLLDNQNYTNATEVVSEYIYQKKGGTCLVLDHLKGYLS